MKRITNRILCEEVMGQASGEVVVHGKFTKWEIEARVEADYGQKFGGIWNVELGQPVNHAECPACTIYPVVAKRVTRANTATEPPKPTPAPQPTADSPFSELALSAMGVANAATMASHAALDGHLEDIQTYLKIIERNVEIFRTRLPGWEPDIKIKCEVEAVSPPKCPHCGKMLVVKQSGKHWTFTCNSCNCPFGVDADSFAESVQSFEKLMRSVKPADTRSLGQVAYEAFAETFPGLCPGGYVVCKWEDLGDGTKTGFTTVANQFIAAYEARKAVKP